MADNTYADDYAEYLTKPRSLLLTLARNYFLRAAAKLTVGKTIDFGCGAGELLELLEPGSVGFEINLHCVRFCVDKGLKVYLTEAEKEGCRLDKLTAEDGFETMITSHVLEHLDEPFEFIGSLLETCERLGISRFVMLVPDQKGFKSDPTHKTFISEDILPVQIGNFKMTKARHFPFSSRFFQEHFTNNELQVIYEKV